MGDADGRGFNADGGRGWGTRMHADVTRILADGGRGGGTRMGGFPAVFERFAGCLTLMLDYDYLFLYWFTVVGGMYHASLFAETSSCSGIALFA
jgi:hypothetical protein